MRGTLLPQLPSRIKGRASLLRRLRALIIAAVRFDRGRARTASDREFSAKLLDGLTATLRAVEHDEHVLHAASTDLAPVDRPGSEAAER